MKTFIINEEEKKRILGMHKSSTSNHYLIKEQEEDSYSDLYGKTVTYKDESTGVEIKGKINNLVKVEPNDIFISHDYFAVTNPDETGYVANMGPSKGTVYYGCKTKTFFIDLVERSTVIDPQKGPITKIGNKKNIGTFTCEGLSNILQQRYPCKTDLSSIKTNVPEDLS